MSDIKFVIIDLSFMDKKDKGIIYVYKFFLLFGSLVFCVMFYSSMVDIREEILFDDCDL